MDMDRREFFKYAGAVGLSMTQLESMTGPGKKLNVAPRVMPKGQQSMMNVGAKPLDKVRVAFIGTGARGPTHLNSCLHIDGVEVVAVCDSHKPSCEAAVAQVVKAGHKAPAAYFASDEDYKNMLDRDDIDAVVIATPWEWHVRMAVDAMNRGKHAFVEVPAAITLEGAWDLVNTSEKTRKHCMMMENVNYGREELMVLNMARMGVFGELLHGEAAYIHDLRGQMHEIEHGTGSWRTLHYAKRNGNLYPTHGLGPVAQYMNINRGDRMDYLSSVSSPARVRGIYAKEHFPEGHARRKLKFVCGDINTTIVKTVMGRTIMIQWDEQLPRPYTRHNLLQGTKGVWAGFPNRLVLEGEGGTPSTDSWVQDAGLKPFYEKFDHPLWKRLGEEAKRNGGHGGMDFVMMWRIMYCLRNGLAPDQDVYDAAAWSAICPLTEWSVANRSQSIDIPDFTRGKWKTGKPLDIVK